MQDSHSNCGQRSVGVGAGIACRISNVGSVVCYSAHPTLTQVQHQVCLSTMLRKLGSNSIALCLALQPRLLCPLVTLANACSHVGLPLGRVRVRAASVGVHVHKRRRHHGHKHTHTHTCTHAHARTHVATRFSKYGSWSGSCHRLWQPASCGISTVTSQQLHRFLKWPMHELLNSGHDRGHAISYTPGW